MGLKERLLKKKQEMLEQMNRGYERTLQKEDERKRKRANKVVNMKPGAKRAIAEGLMMHKSPLDVAREEYSRRKFEREKKYGK